MVERSQTIPQIQNLVVARYKDGKLVKGITYDFGPNKRVFHVNSPEGNAKKIFTVSLSELKAVFFVRSFEGRQNHPPVKNPSKEEGEGAGTIKMKITFFDGETLIGTTQGYDPERSGFFVVPLEKDDNNLRVFVISSAVKQVETWK